MPPKDWAALRNTTPGAKYLGQMSIKDLELQIQNAAVGYVNYLGVMALIRELIRNRGVKPALRHYKVLILANAEPHRGSSVQVQKLLQEMEEQGIVADSSILHAALKV
jgi:hypothetical protein